MAFKTANVGTAKMTRLKIILISLFFICAVLCIVRAVSERILHKPIIKIAQQAHNPYLQESVIVHSDSLYHKMVVPFVIHDGFIMVQSQINGQRLESLVDTGCRDIVWQGINMKKEVDELRINFFYIFGQSVVGTDSCLDTVQLSGLTLRNAFSVHLHTASPYLRQGNDGTLWHVLLGNHVFQHLILTIDYPRRLLILRDTNYDVTKQPRRHQDSLLDIDYDKDYKAHPSYGPQRLYFDAHIEGKKARVVLDTGYTDGILLSPTLRRKLTNLATDLPLGLPGATIYNGRILKQTAVALHWSAGTVNGTSPGYIFDRQFFDKDIEALIGYGALSNYRITIDYTRKKMLLEPVATSMKIKSSTTPLPHMGKHPTLRWIPNTYGTWDETPNEPSNPPLRWKRNKDGHYEEVPYYDKVSK